jgi:hypothetical protein
MPWLTRDAEVLAVLETTPGLVSLGRRRPMEGALLVRRPALVHSLRCPMALDLAWCGRVRGCRAGGGAPLLVHRITRLGPSRIAKSCLYSAAMVVAPAGAFERWRLSVGDRLEVAGP